MALIIILFPRIDGLPFPTTPSTDGTCWTPEQRARKETRPQQLRKAGLHSHEIPLVVEPYFATKQTGYTLKSNILVPIAINSNATILWPHSYKTNKLMLRYFYM